MTHSLSHLEKNNNDTIRRNIKVSKRLATRSSRASSIKVLFTSISWYYGASHYCRDKFDLKTKVEGPNGIFEN